MGFVTEAKILKQDKKAQGETNDRLEALIAEQRRTNELLGQLIHLLTPRSAQPPYGAPPVPPVPPVLPVPPVQWGIQQQR